jgi:hypothetical protein
MTTKETELVDIQPVEILSRDEDSNETDSLIPTSSELTEDELHLLKSSGFQDLCGAVLDARIWAPIGAVLFALIGVYIAIDPFGDYKLPDKPMSSDQFVRDSFCVDELYSWIVLCRKWYDPFSVLKKWPRYMSILCMPVR